MIWKLNILLAIIILCAAIAYFYFKILPYWKRRLLYYNAYRMAKKSSKKLDPCPLKTKWDELSSHSRKMIFAPKEEL